MHKYQFKSNYRDIRITFMHFLNFFNVHFEQEFVH